MNQLSKNVSTLAAGLSFALSIGANAAAQNHGLVARYTAAGALDSTFSGDGLVVSEGTANVMAHGVVVNGAAPGKITAVGAISHAGTGWQQLLGRYNDNGTPDTSFGWLGAATADYPGSTSEVVMAVTVQAGATTKLVVAVQGNDSVGRGWLVERFNGNGALDSTFSGDGFSAMNFDDAETATPFAIANAGLGRIVVAGIVSAGALDQDFAVARYLDNGDLDPSFSGDGRQRVDMSEIDEAKAVAVHGAFPHTNKIVVAGWTLVGSEFQMTAVRLNENGDLDGSFGGGDGIVMLDFPQNAGSGATAVAITSSNKIVLAGSIFNPVTTFSSVAVARLNADGSPDNTFGGGDGMVTTTFAPAPSSVVANSVASTSDGKILIAGKALMGTNLEQVALARYMPNGDLDTTFDGDGMKLTSFFPEGGTAQAMTLSGANRPVVVGWTIDH